MSRLPRRPAIDHAAVAARARQQPRIWHRAGEYRSSFTAKGIAYEVRNGPSAHGRATSAHYSPPGAFEAWTRLTEYGCELLVRYVGGGPR